MNKKFLYFLSVIVILIVLIIIYFLFWGNKTSIIKTSVPQGDEVADLRSPKEACNSLTESSAILAGCILISSEKVDTNSDKLQEKCVDGASLAGCFACEFKCND